MIPGPPLTSHDLAVIARTISYSYQLTIPESEKAEILDVYQRHEFFGALKANGFGNASNDELTARFVWSECCRR